MVCATDLTYSVGGKYLFKPVSFFAEDGTRVFLKGPSASGKSTICRILGKRLPVPGLEAYPISINPYYRGSLEFNDLQAPDCTFLSPYPETQLMATSVKDLFAFYTDDTALQALELTGLHSSTLSRDPFTLSTGEATRLLLAQMLLRCAPLTIIDSPWGLIDASSRSALINVFLEACARTVVIESESIFTELTPLNKTVFVQVEPSSPSDSLLALLVRADIDMRIPRESGEIVIAGHTILTSVNASFSFEIDDLRLQTGRITWVQGDNGCGKTTFARGISMLPFRHSEAVSKYIINGKDLSSNGLWSTAGYVNARFPLGEPTLTPSTRFLTDTQEIQKQFREASNGALDPQNPEKWAYCPILVALGMTLFHLVLKRKIIVVDEPFYGATAEESSVALNVLRHWSDVFDACILVISHLSEPPRKVDEKILRFKKHKEGNTARSTAFIE